MDRILRVLIVDDEQRICTLLNKLIHWESLSLTLCGIYQSVPEALAQLQREGADILICDIEMPEMSGLELLRQVQRAAPECRTIIVSGYRNFEYAHEAMKLGVFRYILKPIDEVELNDTLAELSHTMNQNLSIRRSEIESAQRRGELWAALWAGQPLPSIEICNSEYGYTFRPGRFIVTRAFFPSSPETAPAGRQFSALYESAMRTRLDAICWDLTSFSGEHGTYSILNYPETADGFGSLDSALHDVLSELHGKTQCEFFISVGTPSADPAGLLQSRTAADDAIWFRMTETHSTVFYADIRTPTAEMLSPPTLSPEEKRELTGIIEQIRIDLLPQWVHSQFDCHRTQLDRVPKLYPSFAQSLVVAALNCLYTMDIQIGTQGWNRFQSESCIHQAVNREELIANTTRVLSDILETFLRPKESNAEMYIEKAKSYIKHHFMDDITLDTLAGELNLSTSYLSALFKEVMQVNYSKYLTGVRMEEAKRLLRNTDFNLSQIASQVGYQNSFYFTRIFTKSTGMKPQEYRRLYQKKEHEV